MPEFSDSSFRSCDKKTNIHVRRCTPDAPPRGVVQICHGISEHIGRYDRFAEALAQCGFVVLGNDHLGHGRSAANADALGFTAPHGGWGLMTGDIRRLFLQTRAEFPDVPYFLFGHSMGSFLARTYLILYPDGLDGCILCGTGQPRPAVVSAGRSLGAAEMRRHGPEYRSQTLSDLVFGQYNSHFPNPRTPSDWLSRDAQEGDAYRADPFCDVLPTAALFTDMLSGLAFIGRERNVRRMAKTLPLLLLSGDADPVGEQGAGVLRVYRLFLRCGLSDAALRLYPGARHELLNEVIHAQVTEDILRWLEGRCTPLPKGAQGNDEN